MPQHSKELTMDTLIAPAPATHPAERASTTNGSLPEAYPGCASAPRVRTRYLRLDQVKEKTGLGKTTIYAMQSRGEFPMRVKITGAAVGWVEEHVEIWCKEREMRSTPLPLKPIDSNPTP